MNIKTLNVGALGTNCYIVDNNGKGYIIDPGGDAEYIINTVKEMNLNISAILLTHAHIDHISAITEVCSKLNIQNVFLSTPDVQLYKSPDNSLLPFMSAVKNPPKTVNDLNDVDFEVIKTPGHTKGSVCLYFKNEDILFSGDTLFQAGIGRTDFPGGSYKEIINSVENKLFTLPEKTVVYPGHGPKTTIKKEKSSNPFF